MKKIPLSMLFLLPLFLGIAGLLFAETPDMYYDRLSAGIVKLHQGDLQGAMAQFQEALAENPLGVEGHYYSGVTQARESRFKEAEKSFHEALSLDVTFTPAHFDLGVLYYLQEKDEEAMNEFLIVERIDPSRARVYFYEGLILRRGSRPREAAAKMEKAALLDPDLALQASYHAGSAYQEAGELESARKLFQNVMALLPDGETAQSAEAYLEQIEQQARREKRWDLTLSAGLQYDTNVILEPTRAVPSIPGTITNKSDWVALLYGRARYEWLRTPDWTGRAEYHLYQNLHQEGDLRDFNIQNHNVILNGGRRFRSGEAVLQYELQLATLGGDRYLLRQGIGPRLILQESKKNLTEFAGQLGRNRFYDIQPLFPNNSDRDVRTEKIGLTHYFLLEPKGNVRAGYFFEKESAGNLPAKDDWDFHASHLVAGVTLPPWRQVTAGLDIEYFFRRFANPNEQPPHEKRRDEEWRTIAALTRPVTRHFDLSIQYIHQQNRSNIPVFEYQRSIYGILATLTY